MKLSGIKAELKWDYSFPEQTIIPKGVAADGVSKLYIKVSTGSTPAIQNVKVSLSDGVNSGSSMLGKVQVATTINSYSTEANNANNVTATSSTSQNSDFWFWYVAPDDFSNDSLSTFANTAEREVKAHVVATFTDGTKDSTDVAIKIVRPPLVLVHGIAANEHTWDKFNYGTGIYFINSPLFKQKKAVNLSPHDAYDINAFMLLSPDATTSLTGLNRLNTLQGNIEELRKQGYACNQIDYVCHSMGGCVLRTAINIYPNKFYGTSGPYKNYGKGFVHKAITINTPHNNSPVADAVTEFIPQAPTVVNLFFNGLFTVAPKAPLVFDFIEPTETNNLFSSFRATRAVKNLQVSDEAGGINLAATTVKNHLITGDVDIYDVNTAVILADFDKYFELLDQILKIMRDLSVPPIKNYLTDLLALEKAARVFSFVEWYSQQKGFPNFLGDGDLVVPLSSQLAGLPSTSTNTTIFHNNSFLDANHIKIKDRNDVGNRVKNLLNSSVNSNLFGSTIPATPGISNGRISQQITVSTTNRLQAGYFDTSKIVIVSPVANNSLFADSISSIQIRLKDTVGLVYIDIYFQGKTYTSVSRNAVQSFTVKIDSSYIGRNYVFATATYDRLNGTDHYTDTIVVNVATNATLIGFTAKEDTNYIRRDYLFYPVHTARYTNYYAGIPSNSPDLIVTVSNPLLVQYNTTQHAFYAIADTGTTNAIINYKGFKDTIAFVLLPNFYSGCINRTTSNATLKSNTNWSRSVVPATCDSVVVMPGHTLMIDSSIQIRSLYISPGATVLIQDSTVKLQIGEADAGNQSFTNYGSLTITKGTIAINGNLQLTAGSNFTMSGGELILDANTGYNSTSLPNDKNIFDASGTMNSFSFTGGTLQIIDPPLWSTSQSINCPYNFGDSTTLKFGNGISQTTSNNPNGFGGNLMPAKIGKLVLDAATPNNNRIFVNLNPLIVKSSVQVKSGNLVQKALIHVLQ